MSDEKQPEASATSSGSADDQFEPTPIMPIPDLGDLGLQVRRARRRRQLVALWVAVSLLLLGQAGAAVYLREAARRQRAPQPAALKTALAARPSTLPSTQRALPPAASRPASAPATEPAVAVEDGGAVAKKKKGKRGKKHVKAAAARPAAAADPLKAAGPVDDVVVPPRLTGSAGKGARLFRMGCGLCHGQRAKAVNPGQFSPAQWKRYFAMGAHGRHDKLRAHFTRSELADVKAYLISAAK